MIITKIRNVRTPSRGTSDSAGLDFFIPFDCPTIELMPGQSINIPSGIKMVIPKGYAGIFFNKSGVAVKGSFVGACVVDADYRGEVHLNIHNVSEKVVQYQPGQKITQMLIMPVSMVQLREVTNEHYDSQDITERGNGGFGSTGKF
jgi:dUTP pyrophosphatase